MGLTSRFCPCIDLHDGKVKQIVGGTLESASGELRTNFVSEYTPDYYAGLYRRDNLTGGHVIQLGSGNENAALAALGAWRGGLQLGGGVNSGNARYWLDAGAAKVIVTSFVFENGRFRVDRVEELLNAIGREHLVLDLSCRRTASGKFMVVTDRWQKFTTLEVNRETLKDMSRYCSEFLIHAVDVEGKQSGIDAELLKVLAAESPVPCVYAGGISSFADIELIETVSGGKVDYTIGSALDIFGGKLAYREVVEHAGKTK